MTRALWIGAYSGICKHKVDAARRLGWTVDVVDPRLALPVSKWIDRSIWRAWGAHVFAGRVFKYLLDRIEGSTGYSLCVVEQGELLDSDAVELLRSRAQVVVLYLNDDPFGGRDGTRFSLTVQTIPSYDLVVVVRDVNISEAYKAGARRVEMFPLGADEVVHAPPLVGGASSVVGAPLSEVIFVGTWFPERTGFVQVLIERGVPLRVVGPRWDRSGLVNRGIKPADVRYISDAEYRLLIQGSKIAIGLLSKGNRDQWTSRSAEIPALGGVLCAEATSAHIAAYGRDGGALLWNSPDECADICHDYLSRPAALAKVRASGIECYRQLHIGNEDFIRMLGAKVLN